MSESGGEGFLVGAAYVEVNAAGEDFQPQVEEIVHQSDVVVQVPVVPDGEGFKEKLAAEIDTGGASVTVPVQPDTAGFRLLLEQELADLPPVTVPVRADTAGFASQAEEAGTQAGEAGGSAFKKAFDGSGSQLELFNPGELDAEAETAGEGAGAAFRRGLVSATAGEQLELFAPEEIGAEAAAAGQAAGGRFGGTFAEEAKAGAAGAVGAAVPGLVGDAEEAGATSGESFLTRFGAKLTRTPEAFSATFPQFISQAAQGAEDAGSTFLGKLKGVMSGGLPPIGALIPIAFVAASADMASHFQAAMEQVHTQAGVGQSAIAGLSNDVLNLAGKVGESPDSLSQALYHVESAFQSVGITGPHAMDLVKTAAEGARIGGADLVDVTNALDSAMVSHISGIHSYGQAMGVLNAIVGTGDMKMQDLADAMGTGIMAVAKSYGQSIYQVGAALATFGDNNIRGAKAATDLRMAMQAIQAPVAAGAAALQHLGLTQNQLGQEMEHHGLSAALQMFVQHLKDSHVPVRDWGEYMTEIFGKRAGVGIGVLVDQLDRMKSKFPDLERNAHNFGNAWADTEKTTSQKMHEMLAGFESMMIRLGRALLPAIGDIFGAVTKALPTIVRLGEAFGKIASPIVSAFFTGLAATFHLLFGPLKDITLGILAFAGAMKVVRLAILAYDAVMALSPFGWTVLIAAALVLLVGLIIKYHKQIFDTIIGTWRKIENFFKKDFDIVKPVMKAFDAIKSFVTKSFDTWWKSHGKEIKEVWNDIWGPLKKAFDIFWDGIKQDASGVWHALEGIFRNAETVISEAWRVAWQVMGAYFKATWDVMAAFLKVIIAGITLVIKTAWDVIVGIFNVSLDLITGNWSQAWQDAETMVEQVWNNIKSYFETIWGVISDLFTQELNIIKDLLTTIWDDIFNSVKEVWGDIESWFKTWWNANKTLVVDMVDLIKSTLLSKWNAIKSDVVTVWDGIMSIFTKTWADIKRGFSDVVSGVKTAWDKLKDIFENPVSFLVNTVYDGGIARLWNDVAAKIPGIPPLPIVYMSQGGRLAGYGGGDRHPALLESGETVVSKEHSRQLAGVFQAVGVPGYAAGGMAGKPGGKGSGGGGGFLGGVWHDLTGGLGKIASSLESGSIDVLKSALNAVVKTSATGDLGKMMLGIPQALIGDAVKGIAGKVKKAAAASKGGGGHAGPGGGTPKQNELLAKRLFPFPGSQWQDFLNVVMAESGFSNTAENPSGAYGIAQALPSSKYPLAGRPPSEGGSSNPTAQLTWMFDYIRGQYGTPANAWAHELAHHWYDQGGMLQPGATLAMNGTGQPEMILPPSVSAALSSPTGPIAQLTQTLNNPGGVEGLDKALVNPGGPMAYLQRTLANPGGPMVQLQKTMANPGGPMAALKTAIANPGGPISKLSKGIADPGGPMAQVGKGTATGGTVGSLATALNNADGPMLALADALDAYVAAHPGKGSGGKGGSGGGSGSGGGHDGGGHKDSHHHHDHKSGGGHPLKGHHPAGGGPGTDPGGPIIINVNYNGHKPSPEDHQAAMLKLAAAIGVA